MSIWTREELLQLLSLWKAAYKAASSGQSYTIDGRTLTRQNVAEIRAQLSYLERQLAALSGKTSSLQRIICRTVRK